MIRINLLPAEKRKTERTPLPRLTPSGHEPQHREETSHV